MITLAMAISAGAVACTVFHSVRRDQCRDEDCRQFRVDSRRAGFDASQSIELALAEIIEHRIDTTSRERFLAQASASSLRDKLIETLDKLPHAYAIAVADSNGDMIYDAPVPPPAGQPVQYG